MIRTMIASAVVALAVMAGAAKAEPYKLAVTDIQGLEYLQVEWGPFKEAMEKATGLEFEFYPVNSRTAAAESLRARSVDFVVTGPAEYVVINKLTEARPLIGLGRPDYLCAIIVRADSGIDKITDLKGRKVAFEDVGSTSNHLCPVQLLADYGLEPQSDIQAVHTSRNVQHESLKRGDVAAIGVNYNTWVNRARDTDTSVPPGTFKALARSGDLPNDMILVGAHVPAGVADKVRDGIIAAKGAVIEAILAGGDGNAKYRGMDLVVIDDGAYDVVRSMFTTAGFPQYDKFIGE